MLIADRVLTTTAVEHVRTYAGLTHHALNVTVRQAVHAEATVQLVAPAATIQRCYLTWAGLAEQSVVAKATKEFTATGGAGHLIASRIPIREHQEPAVGIRLKELEDPSRSPNSTPAISRPPHPPVYSFELLH